MTNLWIVGDDKYCGASCQRGGKSQFDKLYRALKQMNALQPNRFQIKESR